MASVQGYMASQIKATLDAAVISKTPEYQMLLIHLAQAYNRMWSNCVKRYEAFFSKPDKEFTNTNRRHYEIILEGLSPEAVQKLDESCWD